MYVTRLLATVTVLRDTCFKIQVKNHTNVICVTRTLLVITVLSNTW